MASAEPPAIRVLVLDLVGVLVAVGGDVDAVNGAASGYVRDWGRVHALFGQIPLQNPLADYPTLWDWHARCVDDLDSDEARRAHLDEICAGFLDAIALLEVGEPTYTIEMLEDRDGAPYLRWWQRELSLMKQRAAKRAVDRILAQLGPDVVTTEWGDNLGDGVFELRIRRTAGETEAWWRNYHGLPEPEPEPHEEVLLRIFFHPFGDKRILLVSGFDKGAHPDREQDEVKSAKDRLGTWQREPRG